jgi:hypothetical protein
LRLKGQPALRRSKLRGLVDKALPGARGAQSLLQRRRRLLGQKVLALRNHLRPAA